MTKKRFISLVFAFFLICSQPFGMVSRASLSSSDTGSVGDADDFITASGAIGGTVALSGFLSASGIYLKASGSSFADVELEIGDLWDAYKSTVDGVKDIADYTGSVVRGGYVLAKNVWNAFGGFTRWLKDKFNLGDNQDNVNLSDNSGGTALLSTAYKTSIGAGYMPFSSRNINFSDGYIQLNGLANVSLYGYYSGPDNYNGWCVWIYNGGEEAVTLSGSSVTLYQGNSEYGISPIGSIQPGQSVALTAIVNSNFNPAFVKTSGTPSIPPENSEESSILSVDTGIINIPDDIPEDATGDSSLGGILISALGAGVGGAAGAIAGSIIDGIMGGVMPDIDIKPADVKIPPGMEIDDDGNVLPSELEFRPTDVFLDSDAYRLDSLNNYFPFSIPWDLLNFAAMFRADPEIPILDFVIPMPDGIDDITIHVDLTPFDSVAILSRSGIFVLFAIRWLMFLYRKFG